VERPAGSVWLERHHRVLRRVRKKVEDAVLLGQDALGFLIHQLDAVPILDVMVAFRH
jgi:hypothetical protein